MALVLGVISDYVQQDYLLDQNDYISGPAASTLTVSVSGDVLSLVTGAVTIDAAATFGAVADRVLGGRSLPEAQSIVAATADITRTSAQSISAVAAVTATTQVQQAAAGSFAAQATQTVLGNLDHIASVSAAAAATVAAVSTVEHSAAIAITSAMNASLTGRGDLPGDINATITATATIVPDLTLGAAVDAAAESSVTVQGIPYVFAAANLTSAASSAISAVRTQSTPIAAAAAASVEIQAKILQIYTGQVSATAQSSTTITGAVTHTLAGEFEDYDWDSTAPEWQTWPHEIWGRSGTRVLLASFAGSISAGVTQPASADLSAEFAAAIDSKNIKPFAISMAMAATQTVAFTQDHKETISLASEFAAAFDNANTVNAALTIGAQFAQAANAENVIQDQPTFQAVSTFEASLGIDYLNNFVEMDSQAQATIQGNADFVDSLTIDSAFAPSITIKGDIPGLISAGMVSTMGITALATHPAQVALGAVAQQTTVATNENNPNDIDWSAFYSQLTIADRRSRDPYRRLIVPSENRILKVLPETRVITIESESRVLRVPIPAWNEQRTRRVA